jgi:hypothetical protein
MVVYALVDPRTDEVCYVGATVNIDRRSREHGGKARSGSALLCEWRASVRRDCGGGPRVVVLARAASVDELRELEQDWIARGARLGWPLLNATGRRRRLVAFRLARETQDLLAAMSSDAGATRTAVVEHAVRFAHQKWRARKRRR